MTDYTPAQQRLIDQHRDINVDYDWWDCTYDYFLEVVNALGFDVERDNVQFSGFWSQGDGASFTFNSCSLATMLEKSMEFIETHEALTDDHKAAMLRVQFYSHAVDFAYELRKVFAKYMLLGTALYDEVLGSVCIEATRTSHHYSHARTVTASWNEGDWSNVTDEQIRETGLLDALQEIDVDEAVEGFANALYAELESEYDYRTSDEAVWDTIEANELDEDLEEDEEEEECEPA